MDYKAKAIEALTEVQDNLSDNRIGEAEEAIKVAIDYLTYLVNDRTPYDIQP